MKTIALPFCDIDLARSAAIASTGISGVTCLSPLGEQRHILL